jgi:hypothetical protein
MSAAKRDREPRSAVIPLTRQVRAGGNPESLETQTIAWHFHRMDWEHTRWGFKNLRPPHWHELLIQLRSLEGLTWAKLKEQCGGRGQSGGTNHHSLEPDDLCKGAKDRLMELNLDDLDVIFSLRLSNTLRLYGIRDGRVLRLLWYDQYHGTRNAVYLTKNV